MNIVLQPRPLLVLGLNVWMGTDAGADAASRGPLQIILTRTKAHPLHLSTDCPQSGFMLPGLALL